MKTPVIVAIGLGMVTLAAAPAQAKDPPGVNPTHFLCYRIAESSPLKSTAVKLKDQFGASDSKLGKVAMLCNPVSKNGEPVKDPKTHLTCFTIKPKKVGRTVIVTHQFGKQKLAVASSYLLCLPSLKEMTK